MNKTKLKLYVKTPNMSYHKGASHRKRKKNLLTFFQ